MVSDVLVQIWNLHRSGRDEEAKLRLLWAWSAGMDGFSDEQWARVALGILRRVGFATDAPEEWAALPNAMTVYRAGSSGLSWTADKQVADQLAEAHELDPVRTRTIRKAEALAYIGHYGEAEVILDPKAQDGHA